MRRNVKGTASRARILAAAEGVFAARGFYGASVRDLAAAADMPTATLLHHYPSKAKLYSAILDGIATELSAELVPVMNVTDRAEVAAFEAAGRELCARYLGWVEARPLRSRILLRELLDIEARLEATARWHLMPVVRALGDFVDAGRTAGAFRPIDPLFFIVHLVGSVSYFHVGRPTFERLDGRSQRELSSGYRRAAEDLVERLLFQSAA